MRRLISNCISVFITFLKLTFLKIFHWSMLHFSAVERFSPNVVIEIEKGGELSIGKKVRMHSGGKIKVRKSAQLVLGDEVSFNYNCMIFCKESIQIDNGVEFGPGVLIYDHDHDFRVAGGIKAEKFSTAPVIIGKNSWIGANTIILKGSVIGENCVIGAGSVVKGKLEDNTILIQKKENIIKKK